MAVTKKAYLVDVCFLIRVTIDENLDPDIDPEFNEEVLRKLKQRLAEEGTSAVAENITEVEEDDEVPWTPEEDN